LKSQINTGDSGSRLAAIVGGVLGGGVAVLLVVVVYIYYQFGARRNLATQSMAEEIPGGRQSSKREYGLEISLDQADTEMPSGGLKHLDGDRRGTAAIH